MKRCRLVVVGALGALILGGPLRGWATPWCDSFERASPTGRTKEIDDHIVALSMLTNRVPKSQLPCVREQLDKIVTSALKICQFNPKDPGKDNPEHKDFFVGVMVGEMISDQVFACWARKGQAR
jgi:hypothetical protein